MIDVVSGRRTVVRSLLQLRISRRPLTPQTRGEFMFVAIQLRMPAERHVGTSRRTCVLAASNRFRNASMGDVGSPTLHHVVLAGEARPSPSHLQLRTFIVSPTPGLAASPPLHATLAPHFWTEDRTTHQPRGRRVAPRLVCRPELS